MKKYLLLLISGLFVTTAQSQSIADALRLGQENLNGSARFRAMGGAFGALGGDLSAINVNPAGSAIFAKSQVGVTLSNFNTSNKSNYFGTKTSESEVAFDLNQAGAAFVFNMNSEKTKWNKFVLSVNYDNTNNFDNTVYSAGTNPNNSIDSYFLSYANQAGLSANDYEYFYFDELSLRERQGYMGYQAFVIDPAAADPNSTSFISNVPTGGNYYQDNYTESSGYNGKLSFNASAAYNDRFYFGLSLNTYFTDYIKDSSFYEENSNTPITGRPSIQSLIFENNIHTFGNGFSFQLGAIAKVTPEFRVGLAYESPTWYELNDEVRQIVFSDGSNFTSSGVTDTDFVVVYDPYNLKTPGKFTGSLAYVFGKYGLLSVDYSIKDYSNTRFRPKDDYFAPINSEMSDVLDVAGELRIGGEFRIKNWSLRGGFRYEESPYKNSNTIGDMSAISGGFGYQFTRTRIDLSYTHAQRDSEQSFFSQGFVDGAKIRSQQNNISLGLVFEL